MSPFISDLNAPLLRLSLYDNFTLDNGCTGVHVFGRIGGGKSSGPGKALAGAYLRAGMGGLVTCAKPGEPGLWQNGYAPEHGRTSSILLFDENEGFNFLTYLLARYGLDGIGSVVECLMKIIQASRRITGSGEGNEAFWDDNTRQVLRYSLPALYAARGRISLSELIDFISSAPSKPGQVSNADWQKHAFMYEVMTAAAQHPKIPMDRQALKNCRNFWANEFSRIPDKTRGNIVITVTSTLDRFRHGRLNKAFCGETTIVPEMSLLGSVILLGMPTTTWGEDGIIGQQLFKYIWMKMVLQRNSLAPLYRERPIFLWSDEAQETVLPSSYEGEFLALCRDSKCCVVYLSQSLPTYVSKMGGKNAQSDAEGLVGKFATHVYCANSCPATNEFASRTIGKVITRHGNYSNGATENFSFGMSTGGNESSGASSNTSHGWGSSSSSTGGGSSSNASSGTGSNNSQGTSWGENRGQGTSYSTSRGYSESMEYAYEPGDFARILKTGGKENNYRVTAVWFQGGRRFKKSGTNAMLETFKQ